MASISTGSPGAELTSLKNDHFLFGPGFCDVLSDCRPRHLDIENF